VGQKKLRPVKVKMGKRGVREEGGKPYRRGKRSQDVEERALQKFLFRSQTVRVYNHLIGATGGGGEKVAEVSFAEVGP